MYSRLHNLVSQILQSFHCRGSLTPTWLIPVLHFVPIFLITRNAGVEDPAVRRSGPAAPLLMSQSSFRPLSKTRGESKSAGTFATIFAADDTSVTVPLSDSSDLDQGGGSPRYPFKNVMAGKQVREILLLIHSAA